VELKMLDVVRIKDIRVVSFIWTAIFLVIAGNFINDQLYIAILFTCSGVFLFLIACIIPSKLASSYKNWIRLGEFIGGITSLIVMFILFFGLFTPVSLIFKVIGKDSLNRKTDQSVDSYWITRTRQPESMKNQF
jgi:hypothetical protein